MKHESLSMIHHCFLLVQNMSETDMKKSPKDIKKIYTNFLFSKNTNLSYSDLRLCNHNQPAKKRQKKSTTLQIKTCVLIWTSTQLVKIIIISNNNSFKMMNTSCFQRNIMLFRFNHKKIAVVYTQVCFKMSKS